MYKFLEMNILGSKLWDNETLQLLNKSLNS